MACVTGQSHTSSSNGFFFFAVVEPCIVSVTSMGLKDTSTLRSGRQLKKGSGDITQTHAMSSCISQWHHVAVPRCNTIMLLYGKERGDREKVRNNKRGEPGKKETTETDVDKTTDLRQSCLDIRRAREQMRKRKAGQKIEERNGTDRRTASRGRRDNDRHTITGWYNIRYR